MSYMSKPYDSSLEVERTICNDDPKDLSNGRERPGLLIIQSACQLFPPIVIAIVRIVNALEGEQVVKTTLSVVDPKSRLL